jgi:transitional endoplasmic reticulum ATPase
VPFDRGFGGDWPLGWFLNRAPVLVLSLFLIWVVRGPLSTSPTYLRKLTKILILSLLVADLLSLLAWKSAVVLLASGLGGSYKNASDLIFVVAVVAWWVGLFRILLSRPRQKIQPMKAMASQPAQDVTTKLRPAPESRIPKVRFAEVGGMEEAKEQIRDLVLSRLSPQKYAAYAVVRNGILLYGPRGSGKTFLAEATAGEFNLNFFYLAPTEFITMGIGESEASIRGAFTHAMANRPALFFIDEIDALGSFRQDLSGGGDAGGGGRSYNSMTIELMQSIDRVRAEPGFVVMAATNVIDTLDEALVRDGRFDIKIHVDLPDEITREKIFRAQLAAKPWAAFKLKEFARRTPGASAAKIRSLVDQAALYAAHDGRQIEAHDLEKAMQEYGGKDRPLFQPVQWQDLILEERVERELRSLTRLVGNPFTAQRMGLQAPMGVLLLGPPGTGKTMIARLIATQTKRSFLPITSADITEPKAVARVFARARQNSPSLIFMDEIDSLVPVNQPYLNQYYVQIVEQFLIKISNLQPEHNVLLVGTTNHLERIDPRILRGGRFSEKFEIDVPGPRETRRLLDKYLAGVELEAKAGLDYLAQWLQAITPADLEAMVVTAKRYAFERSRDDKLVPLSLVDFQRAAERVMGQVPVLPGALSNQP